MAIRDEINALYQKYLGRDGLPEGLDYWAGTVDQGATLEDVEYNIANSPEAAIVNAYQDSLGRTPSIDEIAINLPAETPRLSDISGRIPTSCVAC